MAARFVVYYYTGLFNSKISAAHFDDPQEWIVFRRKCRDDGILAGSNGFTFRKDNDDD